MILLAEVPFWNQAPPDIQCSKLKHQSPSKIFRLVHGLQVPTEYFLLVLGKHLKYSSCLYPTPQTTLDEAEDAMLGTHPCRQVQAQQLILTHVVFIRRCLDAMSMCQIGHARAKHF